MCYNYITFNYDSKHTAAFSLKVVKEEVRDSVDSEDSNWKVMHTTYSNWLGEEIFEVAKLDIEFVER